MAVRMKTKWHRSRRSRRNIEGSRREKTVEELAGVVAFNIWKLAQQAYRNLVKEGFRFSDEGQITGVLTEIIAFLVQVADRVVFGKIDEEKRARFVNVVAQHLADTMEANQTEAWGPGDYRTPFVNTLNCRFEEYAECTYSDVAGPGYAFRRVLGEKVADILAVSDNKWVVEHVMDIEAPEAVTTVQRLVTDVMGLRMDQREAMAPKPSQ